MEDRPGMSRGSRQAPHGSPMVRMRVLKPPNLIPLHPLFMARSPSFKRNVRQAEFTQEDL